MRLLVANFDISVGFYHDNVNQATREKKQIVKIKTGTRQ
jgi:hypothetical protein